MAVRAPGAAMSVNAILMCLMLVIGAGLQKFVVMAGCRVHIADREIAPVITPLHDSLRR